MHDTYTITALFIFGFFVVNGLKAYFNWQKLKAAREKAKREPETQRCDDPPMDRPRHPRPPEK